MLESEKRDATVRIGGAAGNESETGLAPVEPKSLIGIVGNNAHQRKNSLISFPTYELAIVELDDQGCCQERAQMRGLAKKYPVSTMMPRMRSSSFVHGWKHDARSDAHHGG